GFGELLWLHRFAARRQNRHGLCAKCLAQVPPAFAEAPGDEADRLAAGRHAVDDGRLHAAGAGSGERKDRIAGAENVLEILKNLGQNLARFSRAMKRNRSGKFEESLFRNRSRSGGEKALLHDGILWAGPGVGVSSNSK